MADSVAADAVDLALHPLAAFEAADVFQQLGEGAVGLRHGGDVWGEQDVRVAPEGVIRRRWLVLQHVEYGGAELAAVERVQQVGFDQMLAAAHIDQRRAGRQLREQGAVEDALGLLGQRQDAQQDIALAKKGGQLLDARVAGDPFDLMHAARPA